MKTTSTLQYDFWDILRAPRLALSGKYLLAQARPLAYGYAVYLVLTYLAVLLEGGTFSELWNAHTLFPFTSLGLSHWYGWAIWIVGIVIAAGFYDYGNMTVAKLALEELKGNLFFTCKDAAVEARANLRSLWVAAALLIVLIVVLSLLQGLIGLVVLIPYIGEIIYAVIYAVPFVLWSLFVVFLAFGLTTAIFTLPAIVTAREKDAFGATFYIYNVIWTQPRRWVSQTAVGLVMAKIGIFVFGYFLMRALQLTFLTTSLFSGEKVKSIVSTGYFALAPVQEVLRFFTSLYPGSTIDWMPSATRGLEFSLASQPTTEVIASLIIAITLVVLWIVVISYGLNIITCSQLIGFIYIRKCEDGEKLGESPAPGGSDPHELIPKSTPVPESDAQSK
ncbi:MAG: hypothetical protein NT028_05685 [candidate division Zixibacteria bacterium]|nr:hypothetical protein [candidate division Zixibacteria bacterium]